MDIPTITGTSAQAAREIDDAGSTGEFAERLRSLGVRDIHAPQPEGEIVNQYRDPNRLPPPELFNTWHGRVASYGSVQVPAAKQPVYDQLRRHMVESGAGPQAYLASVENPRTGVVTQVLPFDSVSDTWVPSIDPGDNRLVPWTRAETNHDKTKVLVMFNTNAGRLLPDGSLQSPVTVAAHELAHAARYRQGRSGLDLPALRWSAPHGYHNLEEYHVIQQVENPVAAAHGEGIADSHTAGGTFRVNRFTDALPANPTTGEIINEAIPRLQQLTAVMDRYGARPEDGSLHSRAREYHALIVSKRLQNDYREIYGQRNDDSDNDDSDIEI